MAAMNQPLRYVHLEDNEADVVLIQRALREGGFDPQGCRVETADGFAAALQEQGWDLVLADWVLPQFSAPAALAQLNGLGVDLPVIIVTGAVGEETAVEALKAGAHNYVMKDRLIRLVPAVQQAIRETNERRARKQAEGRLRVSEEEHRALFEYGPLMCFLLDSDGIVLKVNRLGVELLGYEVHELVGRSIFSLFPDEYRDAAAGYAAACFTGSGSQLTSWELQKQRKDGSRLWVKEFARILTDGQGRRTLLISCEDITERKQAEAALQQIQVQLQQAQKMDALGQLAGGVAHDFNNLLTGILGNAERALEKLDAPHKARINLTRILEAGDRASQLVQQILAFTHQQELSRTVQALPPLITEVLALLRATLPAGVTLTSTFDAATPLILADTIQLHQVVMNLCTNAWHAMKGQSGSIMITLESVTLTEPLPSLQTTLPPGGYARLSVRDTGSGMDEQTMKRIFEPFFTTKPVGQGTGLGLSVVHGIVQGHGGAILVESRPGHGTTFSLYFPAAAASAQEPAPIEAVAAPVHGRSRHVLYVDDEEMLVELVVVLFESLGYRVTGMTNAADAIALVRAQPSEFDVVVTDYNMPSMSGLDVAKALAQIRANLPVVLVSGYLPHAVQMDAQISGIKKIVSKPSMLQQLGDVVACLLDPKSPAASSTD